MNEPKDYTEINNQYLAEMKILEKKTALIDRKIAKLKAEGNIY